MSQAPGRRLAVATIVLAGAAALCLALAGCASDHRPVRVDGVRLVEVPRGLQAAAWSPDGRELASAHRRGILLRGADGQPLRVVPAPPIRTYFAGAGAIAWSDDGKRLDYLTEAGPKPGHALWATEVSRGGGAPRRTSLGTGFAFGAWAPGGWPLVFVTGRYEPDPQGWRGAPPALWILGGVDQEPRQVRALPGTPTEPALSPGGGQLAFATNDFRRGSLWLASLDGTPPRRLDTFSHVARLAWSPDGRLLAFAAMPLHRRILGPLLYLVGRDGKARRLTTEATVAGPTWSPDGRWIAYSNWDGEIRCVRPDGSADRLLAAAVGDEQVTGLLWSSRGDRLAYSAYTPQLSD